MGMGLGLGDCIAFAFEKVGVLAELCSGFVVV